MRCWIPSGKAISIFKGYLQQEVDYLQYGANRPNDGEKKKKPPALLGLSLSSLWLSARERRHLDRPRGGFVEGRRRVSSSTRSPRSLGSTNLVAGTAKSLFRPGS